MGAHGLRRVRRYACSTGEAAPALDGLGLSIAGRSVRFSRYMTSDHIGGARWRSDVAYRYSRLHALA